MIQSLALQFVDESHDDIFDFVGLDLGNFCFYEELGAECLLGVAHFFEDAFVPTVLVVEAGCPARGTGAAEAADIFAMGGRNSRDRTRPATLLDGQEKGFALAFW
jgi:hypothetical protein